ncbi:putative PurR-regulated permease PerM [Halohasta litchfieldiae]|jgi:Predicted permease|uniref:Predicted PurR-regulated permease PerM n=1 Tax=Halohasta litchfieldiae TaxID=1073996 RepID=A0A1H6TH82_9EURY|nr:AI-2E family transporter [Halohasta litchfieldiae]ATW88808.1 putative PurR-regulated permease PerM [Halohasta litchfieldiae]SEI78646.1 Predicted PurR-regulated permease PerM [Halohasta litchfieldiae]
MDRRPYVLGGVLAAIATVAAVILFEVLGTVFLAISVAYLLVPLRQWLRRRGLSRLAATVAVTGIAVGGVVALFGPLVYLLIIRFTEVTALIRGLPESIPLGVGGFTYELVVADAISLVTRELTAFARAVAAALPVLLVKLTLFVLLVFSLVHNQSDIRTATIAVVPPNYRDIVEALHTRAHKTLFALYVLQVTTALGTFLIALPVFVLFGYEEPIILATTAGVLQFIPIAGPSLLIAVLAGGHLLAGDLIGGLLVAVIGGTLIAWLPDLLIRPRIASRTADLDGSLYFIGFVGGLLSLGAIGIIIGPLVVALLVESAGLVSQEFETEIETLTTEESTESGQSMTEPTDDD